MLWNILAGVSLLTLCSFMEGARIRSSVALPREVAKPTVIEDNGEKVTLKTGQNIYCNLVSGRWSTIQPQ